MANPPAEELAARIRRLPDRERRRALAYVEGLEKAAAGAALMRFASVIPERDLEIMAAAIEADCERIDAADW